MIITTIGAVVLIGLAVYMGYSVGYTRAQKDYNDSTDKHLDDLLIASIESQLKKYGKNIPTKKRPLKK